MYLLQIVDERIANSIHEKHFGNKISLWIKQRLFVSRKYDETINALEKFSQQMKALDDAAALEAKEPEQPQKVDTKTIENEKTPAVQVTTSVKTDQPEGNLASWKEFAQSFPLCSSNGKERPGKTSTTTVESCQFI